MNKKLSFIAIGALVLFATTFYILTANANGQKDINMNDDISHIVQVFKSQYCGCCKGYVSALKENDFQTQVTNTEELDDIKTKYNIPEKMHSCHTSVIGKYFIEGHVPIEAINKLLKEQPDIDGIALPGMPLGTPGMPGHKEAPFIVYQVTDGVYSEFMKI